MTDPLEAAKEKLEKIAKQAKLKIAKLEAESKDKSEKVKNRIKRLEQQKKAKARKADTRRKILAGSMVLERMEKDPAFADKVRADLNRFLTRDIDRELFELPKKRESQDDQDTVIEP